jgi:hypothetical protein
MNFETWWKTADVEALFQDPWRRCQFEIMQRVEQVAQSAYEAGKDEGYRHGYAANRGYPFLLT